DGAHEQGANTVNLAGNGAEDKLIASAADGIRDLVVTEFRRGLFRPVGDPAGHLRIAGDDRPDRRPARLSALCCGVLLPASGRAFSGDLSLRYQPAPGRRP